MHGKMMTALPHFGENIASLRNAVEQHHFERSEKHHITAGDASFDIVTVLWYDLLEIQQKELRRVFVKVCYFGFYPLGSDVKINNIEIMKSEWHVCKKPFITYGKKNIADPFLQDLFFVVSKEDAVFFVAIEWGLGHYHIFTVNQRKSKKLSKYIHADKFTYDPIAVHINKSEHSVRVYGRIVSGARDMNFMVADSFFKLIGTESFEEHTRYTFTNDGNDRFYLDVYSPSMVDNSELFILIGKADKIIWHWNSEKIGECSQEYKLLQTYVEVTRKDADGEEILYYH